VVSHAHNFIIRNTQNPITSPREEKEELSQQSGATSSSLFNRILNSNGVENFIMAVPPAVPHPCAALHLHNHLNRALAPPFKTARGSIPVAEISQVQTRSTKPPLFIL